jgi:hypothetical protein
VRYLVRFAAKGRCPAWAVAQRGGAFRVGAGYAILPKGVLVEDRAMSPVDLQQSAVAMWFPTLHKQGEAAPTRHFGSAAKAVRFVMEELEADARGTALIEVAGYGPLRSDEIASIYRELPSSIE